MVKTKTALFIIISGCFASAILGFCVGMFSTRASILNEMLEARVIEISTVPPRVPATAYINEEVNTNDYQQ